MHYMHLDPLNLVQFEWTLVLHSFKGLQSPRERRFLFKTNACVEKTVSFNMQMTTILLFQVLKFNRVNTARHQHVSLKWTPWDKQASSLQRTLEHHIDIGIKRITQWGNAIRLQSNKQVVKSHLSSCTLQFLLLPIRTKQCI